MECAAIAGNGGTEVRIEMGKVAVGSASAKRRRRFGCQFGVKARTCSMRSAPDSGIRSMGSRLRLALKPHMK